MKLRLMGKYHELERLVNETTGVVRPKQSEDIVEVEESQFKMMDKSVSLLSELLKLATPDQKTEFNNIVVSTIKSWAMYDNESTNVTESDFFPTVIRSPNESEFQLIKRPAILTQYGADKLLSEYITSNGAVGLSKDEFKNAFLTKDMIGKRTIENGEKFCEIKGVKLKLSSPNQPELGKLGSGPSMADYECGLSYTESWVTRWSEVRRYTPFTLCSSYLTWLTTLKAIATTWDVCISYGIESLTIGIAYLASEWACRKCFKKLRSSKEIDIMGLLNAWIANDRSFQIADWMDKWRSRKQYDYVTSDDVGYDEILDVGIATWSLSTLQKDEKVKVAQTNMPFVETSRVATAGYPIQDAALTTSGPIRMFICFSITLEICGSQHLNAMRHHYLSELKYLGKRPGRCGRDLSKLVVQMGRLLLSNVTMAVPKTLLIPESDMTCEVDLIVKNIVDDYAQSVLAHNLGAVISNSQDTTLYNIAKALSLKDPDLEASMMSIFNEYLANKSQREKYVVTQYNTKLLDVITHMMGAGSVEGYVRSCKATVAVSAYTSKMRRKVIEDIDSDAPKEIDEYLYNIYHDIVTSTYAIVPEMKDLYIAMKKLSTSKSAGGDKVKLYLDKSEIIGDGSTQGADSIVSNRKDMINITSAEVITERYMNVKPVVGNPFPVGYRSVPARKTRIIYNLPYPMQLILSNLYTAMKKYQGDVNIQGYSLANKIGVPVADMVNELNTSIRLAHDSTLMCLGIDASSLDQHIGSSTRKVLCNAIDNSELGRNGSPSIRAELGKTYGELLKQVLTSWDDAYYAITIAGAPYILINVDTQPSGALTTANDNSITTMAMLNMISDKLKLPILHKEVWGDDTYILIKRDSTNPAFGKTQYDITSAIDELGKSAGQVLGTVKDSTSGRVVDYLQKKYIGGQIISRRMAYDHETPVLGNNMPGVIGEYLDKARDLAIRGGNAQLLNMLQILTIANGARMTVFGRQASVDFNTMAAPGGSNNRLFTGFSSSNSKLYLQLNMDSIFGNVMNGLADNNTVEIFSRPRLEQDSKVGARILEKVMEHEKSHVTTKIVIGGEVIQSKTLKQLITSSSAKLLDTQRLETSLLSERDVRGLLTFRTEAELKELSYRSSVRNAAKMSLGSVAVSKHMKLNFIEKALRQAHLIAPSLREKRVLPSKEQSERHTGFKIDRMNISYSFETDYTMVLPVSNEPGLNMFILYRNDTKLLEFKQNWHPFYYMPIPYRYLLSLLGVQTSREQLSTKNFVASFSPHEFRSDLTAEAVMEMIRKCPQQYVIPLLKLIGFSEESANALALKVIQIPAFMSLTKASEYASTPDVVKSCSSINITKLLNYVCDERVLALLNSSSNTDLRNVIHSNYAALLMDEISVACATQHEHPITIRMPVVIGSMI